MKISEGYVIKKIAGEYLLIPYGQKIIENNQIMTLNENSGKLLKYIENTQCSLEALIRYVQDEKDMFLIKGDVEEQIKVFIETLIKGGFIEKQNE